jgi:subtilisin family serine protease
VKEKMMDKIKIKRGDKEVTFEKVPDHFAVRLNQGRAADEASLVRSTGTPMARVSHVDTTGMENLEVFAIEDASVLESTMDTMREAPASEVITHMYTLDDTPGGAVIPTGTMTIQFKPDVGPEDRAKILGAHGLEVVEDLDFIPFGYTVRLTDASTENPLKIAAKLQEQAEIEAAEPDLSFKISLKYEPIDSLYREQWHLKNRGNQTGLVAGADVKADQGWEYSRGSRNVIVCVMDDGFDLTHPDLSGEGKIVAPWDFGDNDFAPHPNAADDNHGTACAGVAIAEENGSGVVGLAPGCAFMPVRTSGWISDNAIVDLFRHAMNNNADVISCSWSASSWNFPLSIKMRGIIHKAATQGRRNKKGCVILFAAGNENRPLDGVKNGRVSHQGFALHPDVIAVGASNSLDEHSSYSNFGPELTLCAPSNGSPGRGIVTTDRVGAGGYSSGDYTKSFGGTSSATPLAAGLAALLLSVAPDLTSAEVRQIMIETADKIDPANGAYDGNGHSTLYGHGRINAKKALAMAVGDSDDNRMPEILYMEHRINAPIPDLGDMEDTLPFPLDVQAIGIDVSVEIKHTWQGDLRVILNSPGNEEVILHDRIGASQDDLVRSFRSADYPSLFSSLIGQSAEGDWTIRVLDMAAQDKGTLVKWGLAVTY